MKLHRLATFMLLGLAVFAVSPEARAQDKGLAKGKIRVQTEKVKGSDIPRVVVTAVVDAPPPKVWEVVSNCDKFEQRMPNIEQARIVSAKGNVVICEVEIDLPFPLSNLTARTRGIHHVGPKVWSRKWSLIRGDYSFNDGSWVLTPYGKDGKRTLVVYKVHAEPDTHVPDWVREKAQKSSLPKMIKRIRQEVKKL